MSERFTMSNGRVKDNQSNGDVALSYNLNNDDGRKELVEFLNDREKRIDELNEDISRLHTIIDDYAIDIKNLHHRLRKQERISIGYKEISQILMELIGEIEK